MDLVSGRVKFARGKTGVSRDLPLWPETIQALGKVPKSGKLVFYTSGDKPLIRTTYQINKDGSSKYSNSNLVTSRFCKLIKKVGIQAPKGTGFYTLRRTVATIAARSGDPFAVQRLLGHANLKMATRYVQDVSKQTDRVIENSRKYVIQEKLEFVISCKRRSKIAAGYAYDTERLTSYLANLPALQEKFGLQWGKR